MTVQIQSTAKFERITPRKARSMLLHNKKNRHFTPKLCKRYTRDMTNGTWKSECPDPIVFDEHGLLREGQHRLQALVESGVAQVMLVVRNNPTPAVMAAGRGRKRSAHDQLSMGGAIDEKVRSTDLSVARLWYRFLGVGQPSDAELADFVETYHEMIDFAIAVFGGATRKAITRSAVQAGVSTAIYYEDESRLCEFVDILFTGVGQGVADSGAIRVRDWLLRTDLRGGDAINQEIMRRTQRGVKAFCEREHLKQLKDQAEPLYTLPDRPLQATE